MAAQSEQESERRFRHTPWTAISAIIAGCIVAVTAGVWAGRMEARMTLIEERGSPGVGTLERLIDGLARDMKQNRELLEQHMKQPQP